MARAPQGPVFLFVLAALGLAACRARTELGPPPMPKRVSTPTDPVDERPELPPRWEIDGASVAAEPRLPFELARAASAAGYAQEDIQDYVLAELNGDGVQDAVALVVRPEGFTALALLSAGERIHALAVDDYAARNETQGAWETYAISVLTLADGPALIGLAPRSDSCTRGPLWSFVAITGVMLEPVGRLAVEPYDCAEAEASIEFVRDEGGRVLDVQVEHGSTHTRYAWDAGRGAFVVVPAP